ISGLASFSNCRVMYQPCALASSMVLLIMPIPRSAAGVIMTFAPRNRMSLRRSTLNGSAMVITSGYPLAAQTMARPIPVFPLVASMTVWPGLSSPDCSAASMTPSANRSFTEPSGLKASIFTKRFTPCGAKRLIRTTGVLPIVSTILWYFRAMLPSRHCVVCDEKYCASSRQAQHCAEATRIQLFRQSVVLSGIAAPNTSVSFRYFYRGLRNRCMGTLLDYDNHHARKSLALAAYPTSPARPDCSYRRRMTHSRTLYLAEEPPPMLW